MRFHPKTQAEWRSWLEKNHSKEKAVELVHDKVHTGKRAMSSAQAMDEAICFGWIDTTVNKLDEDKYIQKFVRRTEKGKWSENTLKYGKRLIKEKRMTPAGLKAYKQGLKNPLADGGIPKNPEMSKELKDALAKDKVAKKNFENLAPSYRRMYLRWLAGAKLQETKDKRIKEIVKLSKTNRRKWDKAKKD